jgi:hypothetical protein
MRSIAEHSKAPNVAAWPSASSFVGRLLALVPPPRFHMLRFHGLLAPAAEWRAEVVATLAAPHKRPGQLNLFEVSKAEPQSMQPSAAEQTGSAEQGDALQPPGRQLWAVLLRKVFSVDVTVCVRCGGRMRVLSFATTPTAVARALARAGLRPQPPPAPPVMNPAQLGLAFG